MKHLAITLFLLSSCASLQTKAFENMKESEDYKILRKSNIQMYPHYKCSNGTQKQEFFAEDVQGNPVVLVTCCDTWTCDIVIVKQQQWTSLF